MSPEERLMDLTSRLIAPCGLALLLGACAEEPPPPPPAPPCAGAGVDQLVGDWVATNGAGVDLTTRLRIVQTGPTLTLYWVRGAARATLTAAVDGGGFATSPQGAPLSGQLHAERCTLVVRSAEGTTELLPSLKGALLPWAPCSEPAALSTEGDRALVTATAEALPEGCVGEATLYLDERRVEGALSVDGPSWSMQATVAKAPAQAELHRSSRCGEAPPTALGVACLGHSAPGSVQ